MSAEKRAAHLTALLDALVEYICDYVVLTPAQADAAALWAAHTHVLDAFETTPFLDLSSPEKRCGKTRLFDVLEQLVSSPWRTITPSEAVLFRKINTAAPTLLLDETDAIFNTKNGSNTEHLRALLNAGNRRGTSIPRCVGPTQQLVDFNIFCAKALAGIGGLPDTIADRSIVIRMERKRADEKVRRFRHREAREAGEPIHQELGSWAQDAVSHLELARPAIPGVLDDRAEEAWEPLLAVAEMAGDHWAERARFAAVELSADRDDDEALGVWLLRDIRAVFDDCGTDRLTSSLLAASLNELETSPWGDIRGKALDARALARRLRHFQIRPRTVRFDDDSTAKGYHLEQFEDAFSRYLAASERHIVTTRMDTGIEGDSEPSQDPGEKPGKPASVNGCDGVTDKEPTQAGRHLNGRPRLGDAMYPLMLAEAVRDGHLTESEAAEQYTLNGIVESSGAAS